MKHSQGSALLLVMGMVALLSATLLHAWFMTSMMYDTALQRENSYKSLYLLDVVVDAAVRLIACNYDRWLAKCVHYNRIQLPNLSAVVACDSALGEVAGGYLERLSYNGIPCIVISVWHRDRAYWQAKCCVTKKEFFERGKKRAQVVISHYTIGSGI